MSDASQQDWRVKLRAITEATLGGFAERVYNEIEAAVEASIAQAREDGWQSGMDQCQSGHSLSWDSSN